MIRKKRAGFPKRIMFKQTVEITEAARQMIWRAAFFRPPSAPRRLPSAAAPVATNDSSP